MQNKIKQSETKIVWRSEITPADYNPRKISEEARKQLKANIKKNGIIGGMVWNEQTKNLVSGHQKLSIADEVNKYNPKTKDNDYEIKVEVINVDLKTEKELNIFFNSKSVQGEMDYAKLALMIPDIDVNLAGLDEVDLSFVEVEIPVDIKIDIPTFEPQAEKKEAAREEEQAESDNEPSDEEKKAKIKEIKEKVKEGAVYEGDPYFMVSFDSYENKVFFLERFHLNGDTKFVKGEELAELIDNE